MKLLRSLRHVPICFLVIFVVWLCVRPPIFYFIDDYFGSATTQTNPSGCLISTELSTAFHVESNESSLTFNCSTTQLCQQLIYFNPDNLTLSVINHTSSLHCSYRSFAFNEFKSGISFSNWFIWDTRKSLAVENDFVHLKCSNEKHSVCNTVYFGFNLSQLQVGRQLEEGDFNVVLLVLDGMSQFLFKPLLNQTANLLESWRQIQFNFRLHHRVGINSFPNMAAYLTGLKYDSEESFVRTIKSAETNSSLSDFIWKRFADIGYVTYYDTEERPLWYINSEFSKLINQHPFNYNWWPFYTFSPEQNWLNEYQCIADSPKIHKQLDHLYQFTKRFNDKRQFIYLHLSELIHNEPFRDGRLLDSPLVNILFKWKQSGFLDKTVLFLLGDHGTRYLPGRFKDKPATMLQENMPLLNVVLPKTFTMKHPDLVANLKNNQFKITSQFDVHATLLHLLQLVAKRSFNHSEVGISLFNELGNRSSCSDAHIPHNWCSCEL